MTLEARIGILRDRLVVEGVEYPVRRDGGGWVSVPSLSSVPAGRVRYDALRDRIRIESPSGVTVVPFRWRGTNFTYGGQRYRIGPMAWGHVMVSRGERPVATGRVTMHGVRLGFIAPELNPIAKELTIGLAFRAVAMWLALGTAGRAR